jgi:hypothetical protein
MHGLVSVLRALVLTIGVALALLAISAPGAGAATANRGWVGTVPGTKAFVGVVIRGQAVTAYVCNGARIGSWYTGRLVRGRAVLRTSTGRRMTVRVGAAVTGTVALPGRPAASFALVRARGSAGLFRSRQADASTADGRTRTTDSGWVRLNDGQIKGTTRTRTFVARKVTATVTVFSRTATSTIAPAATGPGLDARVQPLRQVGPCFSIPRPPVDGRTQRPIKSGPSCGLPTAGMKLDARRRTIRVRTPPAQVQLPKKVTDRLLVELPELYDRERARILRVTGLPNVPPALPSESELRRLRAIGKAMVADAQLIQAAAAYRRTPTATTGAAYQALVGRYLRGERPVAERPEVATREASPPATIDADFSDQVLTDGWFVFQEEETEGDDVSITDSEQFGVLGEVLSFGNHVRAGFWSAGIVDAYAMIEFQIAPGAREVEITTDADRRPELHTSNGCFGSGYATSGMILMLHARRADGTYDPLGEAPVDGVYFQDDYQSSLVLPGQTCISLAPPVPEPPFYQSLEEFPVMHISDPPAAGGTYLLTIGSGATAATIFDGQASADHRIGVKKIVVRTRF